MPRVLIRMSDEMPGCSCLSGTPPLGWGGEGGGESQTGKHAAREGAYGQNRDLQALALLHKLGGFLGVKPEPERLGLQGTVLGRGMLQGEAGGAVTLWPMLLCTEAIYISEAGGRFYNVYKGRGALLDGHQADARQGAQDGEQQPKVDGAEERPSADI